MPAKEKFSRDIPPCLATASQPLETVSKFDFFARTHTVGRFCLVPRPHTKTSPVTVAHELCVRTGVQALQVGTIHKRYPHHFSALSVEVN